MTRFVALVGIAIALVGCQPSPPSSDAAMAHRSVQAFLASWKAGEPRTQFLAAHSGWTVAEPRWDGTVKLNDFELAATGKPSGFDLIFQAKLSVERNGKVSNENALYAVSTSPRLIIVRVEPGGG